MVAIERTVCYSSQEEGTHHTMEPKWGSTRVGQKAEGEGKCGQEALL